MNDRGDAEQIRQQMAVIRREVQSDVGEIVEDAQTLLNWRFYVKRYPWVCLSAATAIGYLVVPKRLEVMSPDAETLQKLAKKNRLVVKQKPEAHARGGLGGAVFTMLANTLLRAGVAYLGQQSGKVLGTQAARQPSASSGPE